MSDDERVHGTFNNVVAPRSAMLRELQHPMDAWLRRERFRLRRLPEDERRMVLPGSWVPRADLRVESDD